MRKVDPEMNDRLVQELWMVGRTYKEMAEKIGCHHATVYQWITNGYMPSAHHFANFHRAGMDIIYILTGERHV